MKIPANNQVIFIKNIVAVAANRSCRLWRRVKMSWIHYLCDHHWTQCRHAISDTGQCCVDTNSGRAQMTSKNAVDRMSGRATWQLYAHDVGSALTSCAVTRSNSRSAWCLHDPSAYVAPHDISDVAMTVAPLPPPPPPPPIPPRFFLSPVSRVSTVWQGTVSVGFKWAILGTVIHSGAWVGTVYSRYIAGVYIAELDISRSHVGAWCSVSLIALSSLLPHLPWAIHAIEAMVSLRDGWSSQDTRSVTSLSPRSKSDALDALRDLAGLTLKEPLGVVTACRNNWYRAAKTFFWASIYKNTDTNMVSLNYCNKLIFPNWLTSVTITSLQNHLLFLVCGLSHNSKSSPLIGVTLVRHPWSS